MKSALQGQGTLEVEVAVAVKKLEKEVDILKSGRRIDGNCPALAIWLALLFVAMMWDCHYFWGTEMIV